MKIGIISDIHGNIEGLCAALLELKESDIILCAGDIVGYGFFINECCEALKKNKVEFIWGNHEKYLFEGLPVFAKENLTKDNFDYLKSAGGFEKKLKIDNIKISLFHGSPWNPAEEYIYPDYFNFPRFESIDADLVILGHTHRAMIKAAGKLKIINPGSCGQGRGANRELSCCIFDTKTKEALIKKINYGKN